LAEFDQGPLKGGLLFLDFTGVASHWRFVLSDVTDVQNLDRFARVPIKHLVRISDQRHDPNAGSPCDLLRAVWLLAQALAPGGYCAAAQPAAQKNHLPRNQVKEIPSQFILSDCGTRHTLFSLGGCDSVIGSDPPQTKVRF
jgi:hypothetical protein